MTTAEKSSAHYDGPCESANTRPVQAIILAAGRGSRMDDEQNAVPKCLLEIGGRSLLQHQLDCLNRHNINDVCVVSGYRSNAIADICADDVHFIHNPLWASTNSLFSLSLTEDWVNSGAVIMNCDVLAHPAILDRLLYCGASTFAFDSTSGQDDEHMKVRLGPDGHLRDMSKAMSASSVDGENVGMLYFAREDAARLFAHAREALAAEGRKVWMAAAVQRLAREVALQGVDVHDLPWTEIDFPEDLDLANARIWPSIRQLDVDAFLPAHAAQALTPAADSYRYDLRRVS